MNDWASKRNLRDSALTAAPSSLPAYHAKIRRLRPVRQAAPETGYRTLRTKRQPATETEQGAGIRVSAATTRCCWKTERSPKSAGNVATLTARRAASGTGRHEVRPANRVQRSCRMWHVRENWPIQARNFSGRTRIWPPADHNQHPDSCRRANPAANKSPGGAWAITSTSAAPSATAGRAYTRFVHWPTG